MPKEKQWSIVDIHSAQKCDLRKDFFPSDVVTFIYRDGICRMT